ncbi:hypothetical protein [Nocardioides halotolerans]|uniref:hypothetical protein n=1 Tax=Nocardioides halotolerans TaxID=433660 RepID=UPI000491D1ED|nr:hypothetical protein [Nocardioides halotolerans]
MSDEHALPQTTSTSPGDVQPGSETAGRGLPTSSPLTLVIHDGEGTWHAVSALKLVGLLPEELADLEDGDESLLDDLPSRSVLEALQAQNPDLADDIWT